MTAHDPSNFVDHCRSLAHSHAGRTAYTWLRDGEVEEAALTFEELDAQARKVAAHLEERGVSGGRALLLYAPGLEFIAAFLGCLYARVVAVPLNAPRNAQAAATMLGIAKHAEPSVLLTDSIVLETSIGEQPLFHSLPVVATDRLALEAGDFWRPGIVAPDQIAFLQYTSGSTGSPKGVEVSHRNLVRNEQMIRAGFGHDEHTIFAGWLPLFHDMGLVGNVLQPLFLGIQSVLMAPTAFVQKPFRWLQTITKYRATTAGGPNFGYELCVQRVRPEQLEQLDLSSWKVAYNGSEPIRAQTLRRFEEKFGDVGFRKETFYPCYGMAEASLYVTGGVHSEPFVELDVDAQALQEDRIEVLDGVDPERKAQRLVGCGKPWLDQEVLVVDPQTRVPAAPGNVGEIWLRGENIARGYRNFPADEPDPFQAMLAGGEGPFLRTGDLGFLRDGELFVTGRLKDLLIQKGQNYYPQDIELAAGRAHASFRVDCTAAFTVDEGDAERLVVVQEVHRRHTRAIQNANGEAAAMLTELTGAVRQAVANTFGLHVWRVVLIDHASIPKTSSGKIQRRKCRNMWRRGELVELGTGVTEPTG